MKYFDNFCCFIIIGTYILYSSYSIHYRLKTIDSLIKTNCIGINHSYTSVNTSMIEDLPETMIFISNDYPNTTYECYFNPCSIGLKINKCGNKYKKIYSFKPFFIPIKVLSNVNIVIVYIFIFFMYFRILKDHYNYNRI